MIFILIFNTKILILFIIYIYIQIPYALMDQLVNTYTSAIKAPIYSRIYPEASLFAIIAGISKHDPDKHKTGQVSNVKLEHN